MRLRKATIPALLAILVVEFVAVHALIQEALKSGNDALDTWHDITEEPRD